MKRVAKHIAIILALILLLLIGALQWLKWYTHNGEKLVLPDYIDKPYVQAVDDAKERSFEIIITDSVFLVGKSGGLIINQNPRPGSEVKRKRKIYVTVTKTQADMISVANLPRLYGESYELKQQQLAKGYELESEIIDYIYDSGQPDMIMEVKYRGKVIVDRQGRKDDFEIPKGGKLQFVLSKSSGGEFTMPDLVCKNYDQAKFLIENSLMTLGEVSTDGTVTDLNTAVVYRQDPPYSSGIQLIQGDTINLYLTKDLPPGCDTDNSDQ